MSSPISARQAAELLRVGGAPPGLCVQGVLRLPSNIRALPAHIDAEVLDFSECPQFEELPVGLSAYEINLSNTRVRRLPGDLRVESTLNLTGCDELASLPAALKVGTLILRGCTSLEALPEDLDVWFLNLTGCWNFQRWPDRSTIRSGRVVLRGCAALTSLPADLGPLAALDVRDCPNLRDLPAELRISGWVDVAQSGIADLRTLPRALRGVDLRWQGVRVEERIVFRRETITKEEILAEKNAERRRVLLDRFGVPRFMAEAGATPLDQDADAGGPRALLRLEMQGDEPLVTLSCRCPSTGRQYFLRVPPATKTCHEAAAWIAGFDDPADYHPLQET